MIVASSIIHAAYFVTVALVLGASIAALLRSESLRWGGRIAWLAVAVGAVGLTVRTLASGHLPIFGTFENTYTSSWVLLTVACVAAWKDERLTGAWRYAAPWSFVLQCYGLRFRSEPVPLTISEQSLIVDVHVVFAWLAFAGLIGASTIAVRTLSRRRPFGLDAEEADDIQSRLVLMGFCALSAMLVTGAFYLWILFGSFWRWEVVETLSLLAWLGYGLVVHVRLFYGWSGWKLAAATVAVLPLLILAFWIWSVFPATYHYFDIPLIRPY